MVKDNPMVKKLTEDEMILLRDALENGEWPDSELVGKALDSLDEAAKIIDNLIGPAMGRAYQLSTSGELSHTDQQTLDRISQYVEEAHTWLLDREEEETVA